VLQKLARNYVILSCITETLWLKTRRYVDEGSVRGRQVLLHLRSNRSFAMFGMVLVHFTAASSAFVHFLLIPSVFSPATQSTAVSHQRNGLKHAQQQLISVSFGTILGWRL